MTKTHHQKLEPKRSLGWTLFFAVAWPILIALLVHGDIFDSVIVGLSAHGANVASGVIVLLPPAIALFPLAYRLDSMYDLKKQSTFLPTWQRVVIAVIATVLALWALWYVYVFTSIGLSV